MQDTWSSRRVYRPTLHRIYLRGTDSAPDADCGELYSRPRVTVQAPSLELPDSSETKYGAIKMDGVGISFPASGRRYTRCLLRSAISTEFSEKLERTAMSGKSRGRSEGVRWPQMPEALIRKFDLPHRPALLIPSGRPVLVGGQIPSLPKNGVAGWFVGTSLDIVDMQDLGPSRDIRDGLPDVGDARNIALSFRSNPRRAKGVPARFITFPMSFRRPQSQREHPHAKPVDLQGDR